MIQYWSIKMRNILKVLLSLFLLPALLLSQPHGGQVTIGGSPGMTAFTGHKLTFATQGPQDIQFLTNNIVRLEIDGTTGALTGAGGAALPFGGTLESAGAIILKVDADANRLFTFDATSDTALSLTFGDSTTANQDFLISGGLGADLDTTSLILAGGSSADLLEGGYFVVSGNEVATTGGSIVAQIGNISTANLDLRIEHASSAVRIRDTTTGNLWEFQNDADFVSDATNGGHIQMLAGGKMFLNTDGLSATLSADLTTLFGASSNTSLLTVSGGTGGVENAMVAGGADANGASLNLLKTRATDGSGNTVVSSGDDLGSIIFRGADGTDYAPGARIFAETSAAAGSDDMPTQLVFQTTPDGSATLTTGLTIGSDQSATFTGAITSSIATTIGWSVVDQTDNQACNTGCTSGCVFGIENATGTAITGIVSCAATTSDLCVCAGAS
jgi:hypothetical protein